jgi:ribosome biogenesis GTPase
MKGFVVGTGPTPLVYLPETKQTLGAWLKKTHLSIREKSVTLLALGDNVDCTLQTDSTQKQTVIIHHIDDPTTMLSRESIRYPNRKKIIAANLDQVFIVLSAQYPVTALGMIDRMTVAALSGGLKPIIVMNKFDLLPTDPEEFNTLNKTISVYEKIFPLLKVSAKTGFNIDKLKEMLNQKKSIFIGQSGVGKTALVKALTGIELRTGIVSESNKKGQHTTSESILYQLNEDSWLADVPGIKQFGFIQTDDPIQEFPELWEASRSCKFSNCKHNTEPGCFVQKCIKDGSIDPKRLESYKKLKDELEPDYFKDRVNPEEKRAPRERSSSTKRTGK